MAVRYKKHLILPTIDQDEGAGTWTATAHIQFTEKLSFHNVIIQNVIIQRQQHVSYEKGGRETHRRAS
jgi:hypothetical protein